MKNPLSDAGETKPQRLWPVHCVWHSAGAKIIPEIHADDIDLLVKKGMDVRVEMYSAFADAFGNKCVETKGVNVDVAATLKEKGVTDVYVVGLAGDYCVKSTAIDAAREGFKSWVIEEGVKSVDPGQGWEDAQKEMEDVGIRVVSVDGPEVKLVKELGALPDHVE
jgi:nicotinamidase-related amidase